MKAEYKVAINPDAGEGINRIYVEATNGQTGGIEGRARQPVGEVHYMVIEGVAQLIQKLKHDNAMLMRQIGEENARAVRAENELRQVKEGES